MKLLIPINTFAEYYESEQQLGVLRQHLKNVEKEELRKKEGKSNPVFGNTARAQIRSTILAGVNHKLTVQKLKEVRSEKPEDRWHTIDQKVNINILESFQKMTMPEAIIGISLEKVLPLYKEMPFYGVAIKIVPTLIFRANINGKNVLGACMVHNSKKHPFSVMESKIVATLLYMFLSYAVAEEDDFVDPELCFCIDSYAGTTVISNEHFPADMKTVKKVCSEIHKNWNAVLKEKAA